MEETPPFKLRWYQYRLRSLLLLMLATCIVMSFVAVARKEREKPCSMGGGQSSRPDHEYPNIECLVWCDGNGRPYYAIALGYADFDPNLPVPLPSFRYTYTQEKGGQLLIDGKEIELFHRRHLLALDPFGRMVELALSPSEETLVAAGDPERVWEDVVLKRLYRREGRRQHGVLVGHWTYRDAEGRKAYEGTYAQGKRDGKWTYYYQSGRLRAEMMYKQGKLDGECKYYAADGTLKDTVRWRDDRPLDRTVRQVGLQRVETRGPGGSRVSSGL
jgi:hypothetical protein